jgi:hypothetical protein
VAVSLDDILKKVNDARSRNMPVNRINVNKQATPGKLVFDFTYDAYITRSTYDILIHPDDWLDVQDELERWDVDTTKPLCFLWGVPVYITDKPVRKPPRLSIRARSEGPVHSLEVFDKFGNKLGEVDGVSALDYHADAHDWGTLTVTVRIKDGGLDGP